MDLSQHPLVNSVRYSPAPEVRKGWEDDDAWSPVDGISGTPGRSLAGMRARVAYAKTLTPEETACVSVSVSAAVRAYNSNIPRAKLRAFTASGEEIIGGDVIDLFKRPYPGMTFRQWVEAMVTAFLVRGEMAAIKSLTPEGRVYKMAPLWPHPALLRVKEPTKAPRYRSDVSQWEYIWPDGNRVTIADPDLLFDREFNPNGTSVRGLSRLEVAGIVATTQHQSEVYSASFFANGAHPSSLINVGENIGFTQLADFDRKYHAKFGGAENAHKTIIASGKGMEIMPLEQAFQGGQFMELQQRIDGQIGQIFNVPPIMMGGVLAETRFKTAPEEKKQFAESALIPMMERLSEAFQSQIVDPHFRGSNIQRRRPRGKLPNTDANGNKYFSKAVGEAFEKAVADRPDSGIFILYDSDTLPIIPESKLANAEQRKAFRETYNLSPKQLAQHFGDELPDEDDASPARTHVWVDNNKVNLTDPKMNEMFIPGLKDKPVAPATAKPSTSAAKKPTPKKELSPADKSRLDKAVSLLSRKLRLLTLDRLKMSGELWGLNDADALNVDNEPLVKAEIRQLRFELREAFNACANREEMVSAAKVIFGGVDKKHVRKAMGL